MKVGCAVFILLIGCSRPAEERHAPDAAVAPPDAAIAEAGSPEEPDAGEPDAAASLTASAAPRLAPLPGTSEGCPDDMVLVHGNYCPEVGQVCIEHHEEYAKDEKRKKAKREKGESAGSSTVSERCMRYQNPSKCLSKKRRPMRFCMDRYEWPNKKGELPALLISWVDARKECERIGKRLCTEDEFNFACEGEEMLPYTYGYVRDPQKCSIDKPYRKREKKLFKYARCMADPQCKAELERLDQRLPVGSLPECVSPFGVFDLNGNINEWVMRPDEKYPNRSGLKGGWWGPVRGRCRPTVGFHKEEDYGYEEGFRCCDDAEAM
jgi:formylglycine-generating enzyme required for sulfatase activity